MSISDEPDDVDGHLLGKPLNRPCSCICTSNCLFKAYSFINLCYCQMKAVLDDAIHLLISFRHTFHLFSHLDQRSTDVDLWSTCSPCLATTIVVGSPTGCFLSHQYHLWLSCSGISYHSLVSQKASWAFYNSDNSWNDLLLGQDSSTRTLLVLSL